MQTGINRRQRGFTLIELIVALAIMGVLAAIAVPSTIIFLNRGGEQALNQDISSIRNAVNAFKSDKHKGPNATPEWGLSSQAKKQLYPTKNDAVASLELDTALTDSTFTDRSNYKIMVYAAGPSVGTVATDAQITAGAVWMGLLVNEPFAAVGTENQAASTAHPLAGESGRYLQKFPQSSSSTNSGSFASGTYTWVVLQNGDVVPGYPKATDEWYSGNNDTFP